MKVVPTPATLSTIFDSVFEMDHSSRSDIDQLVREMTMEAAGEVPPKDPKKMTAAEKKKAEEEAKKKAEEDSRAAAALAESAESRLERER